MRGTALQKDQNENTSHRQQNVNIGQKRASWSRRQQVEQAPLPLPSTPICRKLMKGIENMFVDNETILPHSITIPTGSGKIGTIGKVGIIEAHRQQDGVFLFVLSPQNGRPVHSRSRTWR